MLLLLHGLPTNHSIIFSYFSKRMITNMRGQNNNNISSATAKVPQTKNANNNNNEGTITLPRTKDVTGVQDTIYLCNFRVSVDGEWLCLKELQDGVNNQNNEGATIDETKTIVANDNKCNEKIVERDWVNYYCRFCFVFLRKYYFSITYYSHEHSHR